MDLRDLYFVSLCDRGMYFYSLSWIFKATVVGFFGIGPIMCFDVVFAKLHTLWQKMGFEMHKATIGSW